jgi:hypothetical protein
MIFSSSITHQKSFFYFLTKFDNSFYNSQLFYHFFQKKLSKNYLKIIFLDRFNWKKELEQIKSY